jgi:glycosyltransferase involved in cell wall biosynthesis
MRIEMARVARLIIFPNAARSSFAREELGFAADRLYIVWNLPRLDELPMLPPKPEKPLVIYYHGSITPERLPETIVDAVKRLHGRARLVIAGYEAPGAPGYIARLLDLGRLADDTQLVRYAGQYDTRENLLREAACAHVGLALMPSVSTDINMRHMTGASNKAFDYMAAGLALLVSDLPEWDKMFLANGFAVSCDPTDPDSVSKALRWFMDHPAERRSMAARARAKIEEEWNYDTAFAPVTDALEGGCGHAEWS